MTSLGARLKEERVRRGVTLDEISRSTKIGTRLLRALEDEHFDQLPGGIFNKGFIRAYARFLGIDEEQAIADYLAATGSSQLAKKAEDAEEFRMMELRAEAQSNAAPGLPWGAFAIVLLVAALGFAVWGFHSREQSENPVVRTPPVAASQTSPEPPQNPSPREVPVQPAAVPASTPPTQPTTGQPANIKGSATTSPTSVSTSPSAPGSFVVLIKAREDSWISITVDGEVTMQNTLIAPTRKSVRAQQQIVVKVGNAGGLDFEFNGKKLPVQGEHGEVKTLTFDAKGLQPPTPEATEQP